ncbi:MAG: AraC family transcriptional regulator [Spirochaetaceae bacterium]|nr:AraC family transcriptional regulator [Spirochaetaceae bacterium]
MGVKTGYPDQFHFSKKFSKTTGISPLVFRKAHIINNVQI